MGTNSSFYENETAMILKNMVLMVRQIYVTLYLLTCCIFQEYLVLANLLGDGMQKLIPKDTVKNEGLELFS